MPPVTAERSPPASRITGADSPVIADSSTEPTPSITSPSAGMTSPASTTTTSPRWSSGAGTSSSLPSGPPVRGRRGARRASAFACALPRPSAIASAKFANSTVSQSQTAITPTNQRVPVSPRARSSRKITVVITLPSSTMNITGFRSWSARSSFGNESLIATSTRSREKMLRDARAIERPFPVEREVQLEDVHAGLAEEAEAAPSVFSRDQLPTVARGRSRGPPRCGAPAAARTPARCRGRCPSRTS